MPQLTIVMPFFNQKEKVSEMIDSILANDFHDWELLAVDDGSDEETLCFLEKYTFDERIRFIRRTILPKGAQTCRNLGLEQALGEFIIFFDSDDCIRPFTLRMRVEAITNHPDLDFMVFPSGVYRDGVFMNLLRGNIYGYSIYRNDFKAFLNRTLPFIVWNNIYRASSLRKHAMFWDTNLISLQDADFNIQAFLMGLKYDYVCVEPDYGYRITSNVHSVSQKIISKEHYKSHLYAVDKVFRSVQQRYGHKYDWNLYRGALLIYNRMFTEKIDLYYVRLFVNIVRSYSKYYGILLKCQVELTVLLQHFMSFKRARQIPMGFFLLYRYFEDVIIYKKIKEKIIERELVNETEGL